MVASAKKGQKRRGRKEVTQTPASTAQLISALNHQCRREILRLLHESDEPQSPSRISKELKIPLSTVSYHVKVLKDLGAIQCVRKRPARGAIENFYNSVVDENQRVVAMLKE
jgi:DNA-binding transcriptional ArsR family regulator